MFVYGYATAMFRGKEKAKVKPQLAAPTERTLATVWCEPFSDVAKGWIMVPVQMLSMNDLVGWLYIVDDESI